MSRMNFGLRMDEEGKKMDVVEETTGEEGNTDAFRFAAHLYREKKMDFLTMFPW